MRGFRPFAAYAHEALELVWATKAQRALALHNVLMSHQRRAGREERCATVGETQSQSGAGFVGAAAKRDPVRSSILTLWTSAQSARFLGRYSLPMRHRSNTDASMVSLIV
jgi:hypothetical protein